jgi:hypothetical protein
MQHRTALFAAADILARIRLIVQLRAIKHKRNTPEQSLGIQSFSKKFTEARFLHKGHIPLNVWWAVSFIF